MQRKCKGLGGVDTVTPTDREAPASVLDASALLAHLNEETGASVPRAVQCRFSCLCGNLIAFQSSVAGAGDAPSRCGMGRATN